MSETLGLGSWGRLQVVIYGIDVTFFRGMPVVVKSWSSGDPFDDGTAVLEFPSITPYEILGVGDLFWLQPYANVEINIVRPSGAVDVIWEGMIGSVDDATSSDESKLQIECLGALYQMDFYISKPMNRSFENMRLYEEAIMDEFLDKPALRIQDCTIEYPPELDPEEGTGWKTRYSGAWDKTLTGFIQRLLADMIHSPLDGDPIEGQWTLMKKPGRIPVLKVRDEETIDYTIPVGYPGVNHDLKSDHTQAINVIYGEGTDESDTTWRNAKVEIDTEIDPPEVTLDYYPVGWDETVHPATKSESIDGEPTSPHPGSYSPDYVRVENAYQFGGGVSLVDARRSSHHQIFRELAAGHFGTITLGVDPPQGSRFEIKAGQNILLQRYRGESPPIDMVIDELIDVGIFTSDDRREVITRGQYCTVLVRMLEYMDYTLPTGSTSFNDVAGTAHQDAIEKLEAAGIAFGYGDSSFGPGDDLTRGQLAGLMVRVVEWAENTTLTYRHGYFYDTAGTEHEENINKAYENYLIRGNPNRSYSPGGSATRQQAGIVLQRINRFLGGSMLEDYEGVILHISQVEIDYENASVSLTVDSKFRDLATLSDMIERNKSAHKNPAKTLMANRESGIVDDTKFPWDYNAGSGSIPLKSFAALQPQKRLPIMPGEGQSHSDFFIKVDPAARQGWTLTPIVTAGRGSVQRTEIRCFDASGEPLKIPFHAGFYVYNVTHHTMPVDPFERGAWEQEDESGVRFTGYDPSAVILWGQWSQRAGYSPGLESEDDPPSGVLIDDGTWQFQLLKRWEEEWASDDEITLWLALYAKQVAYFQGRLYHGVQ